MTSPAFIFPRGAIPTPRHILAAATPHVTNVIVATQCAVVPKQLSMWGNDKDGDCVSAEEAFNKACANPEIFIQEDVLVKWASDNGYLNGADLTDVMKTMATNGIVVGNQTYDDGPYTSVDFSNEANLQSAISTAVYQGGSIKLGIDADALPSGAGNQMGWTAWGGKQQFKNEDHCVATSGFGPVAWLAQQLGVTPPSGAPANGYLLYTWKTIGIVSHDWLMDTCGEAWLRSPSTVGVPPLPTPAPSNLDWIV